MRVERISACRSIIVSPAVTMSPFGWIATADASARLPTATVAMPPLPKDVSSDPGSATVRTLVLRPGADLELLVLGRLERWLLGRLPRRLRPRVGALAAASLRAAPALREVPEQFASEGGGLARHACAGAAQSLLCL